VKNDAKDLAVEISATSSNEQAIKISPLSHLYVAGCEIIQGFGASPDFAGAESQSLSRFLLWSVPEFVKTILPRASGLSASSEELDRDWRDPSEVGTDEAVHSAETLRRWTELPSSVTPTEGPIGEAQRDLARHSFTRCFV